MSHFHPLTVLSTIQVAFIRRYYLIEREIIFDLDIRSYSKPSHKLKLAWHLAKLQIPTALVSV